ncbi:MAG: TIGR03960 family B12-binding radical SAM protein, partial [Eubacteriales bacterium]|nr:TIGR03960 family B12-binding radical SAM protein [Eubacteriales bacterium]
LDMDRIMRELGIPLFALESQDPIREFDFLGITLQFELCYTNVLQILDLSGIPLCAADRDDSMPIVIGGGPCTYNPEPVAPFFDMFYIGEGEVQYDALLDLYREMKEAGSGRQAFLLAAARQIPGIYVPSLYDVAYNGDGTIRSFTPNTEGVPARVRKQAVRDLDSAPYPLHQLVPFMQVTQDRVVVEIQRGCIRGCRFCQAGMVYRPNRERSLKTLKRFTDELVRNTGQDDINLSSLSSSDYTCIRELVNYIVDNYASKGTTLQLPSLRIDTFSLDVMQRLQEAKRGNLTFAPEAGSQRLRDVINKGITEEEILEGAREAFRGGWKKVKLYFMLGLPTETEEDRREIIRLANRIAVAYFQEVPKEKRNGRCDITVSTSFFVPKPFTPFQWAPMYTPEEYLSYASTVYDEIQNVLNRRSIWYKYHEADGTVLEGFLARGDRRCAAVIAEAYRLGALYDAWIETWDFSRWVQACQNTGVDMDFYALRARRVSEILPWDFIDIGVSRKFLEREWLRAQAGEITPNCREACSACGAAVFGSDLCLKRAGK